MHQMLQNVGKSIEAQDMQRKDFEAGIKAFDAETKRMQAFQASMSPEQIQDIVLGTVHSMITSGDLVNEMPSRDIGAAPEMPQPPQGQMPPPQGMSQ